MKKQFLLIISLFLFISTSIKAQDLKANKIVEDAVQAMGGKELLLSISTLYTKSATVMDGHNVNWITKEMTPNKGSFIIEFQGRIVYKSFYDGEKGYKIVDGEKQLADQNQYNDKPFRTNIFNEIDYLNPSLYKLEFIKEEVFDSKKCNKLRATLKNNKITYLYFDMTSKLLVKSETVKNGNSGSFSIILFENYKKYGELIYFSKMILPMEKGEQIVEIDDLYYNQGITQKDFE